MASPFLTQDFHIRWSTLAPAHIQEDIRQAIQKAEAAIEHVSGQDRGKMTFDSVTVITLTHRLR